MCSARGDGPPADGASDPAALRSRVQRQCAAIERRELETATRKLKASGNLSDPELAVIEEMADRIVARLLAPPTAALAEADRNADPDELAAIARLFEPDHERAGEE